MPQIMSFSLMILAVVLSMVLTGQVFNGHDPGVDYVDLVLSI